MAGHAAGSTQASPGSVELHYILFISLTVDLKPVGSSLSGVHQSRCLSVSTWIGPVSTVKNIAVISISALATLASLWLMVSFA